MDEVGDALSRRLGLVGAGRWLCRKWVTFSSVGGDGSVLRGVLVAMEDVVLLVEEGLLMEEGLDKRLEVSDWVGLDWDGESGED